jgi:hypothetical protein
MTCLDYQELRSRAISSATSSVAPNRAPPSQLDLNGFGLVKHFVKELVVLLEFVYRLANSWFVTRVLLSIEFSVGSEFRLEFVREEFCFTKQVRLPIHPLPNGQYARVTV